MPWSAIHSMSMSTRCAIIIRDNFTCCWCNRHLTKEEIAIDHVIPRSPYAGRGRAGTHKPDNLVVSCRDCNTARGNGGPDNVATFRAHLARYGRTIGMGMREAKRRVRLPLDRVAGRALARQWYPGRLEYLPPNKRKKKGS